MDADDFFEEKKGRWSIALNSLLLECVDEVY